MENPDKNEDQRSWLKRMPIVESFREWRGAAKKMTMLGPDKGMRYDEDRRLGRRKFAAESVTVVLVVTAAAVAAITGWQKYQKSRSEEISVYLKMPRGTRAEEDAFFKKLEELDPTEAAKESLLSNLKYFVAESTGEDADVEEILDLLTAEENEKLVQRDMTWRYRIFTMKKRGGNEGYKMFLPYMERAVPILNGLPASHETARFFLVDKLENAPDSSRKDWFVRNGLHMSEPESRTLYLHDLKADQKNVQLIGEDLILNIADMEMPDNPDRVEMQVIEPAEEAEGPCRINQEMDFPQKINIVLPAIKSHLLKIKPEDALRLLDKNLKILSPAMAFLVCHMLALDPDPSLDKVRPVLRKMVDNPQDYFKEPPLQP